MSTVPVSVGVESDHLPLTTHSSTKILLSLPRSHSPSRWVGPRPVVPSRTPGTRSLRHKVSESKGKSTPRLEAGHTSSRDSCHLRTQSVPVPLQVRTKRGGTPKVTPPHEPVPGVRRRGRTERRNGSRKWGAGLPRRTSRTGSSSTPVPGGRTVSPWVRIPPVLLWKKEPRWSV